MEGKIENALMVSSNLTYQETMMKEKLKMNLKLLKLKRIKRISMTQMIQSLQLMLKRKMKVNLGRKSLHWIKYTRTLVKLWME